MLIKVLLAIILGAIVGSYTGKSAQLFGVTYFEIFEVSSQLFLNSLTLLAIPMVACAIISGLGQLHQEKSFAKLGKKTFGFYILTITVAVLIGVTFFNIINPGHSCIKDLNCTLSDLEIPALSSQGSTKASLFQVFYKLIPSNIIEAASSGNMLGVIFFSLLFGFALLKLDSNSHGVMLNFWKALFQTLMKITQILIKALPIGVFCLMAKLTASSAIVSAGSLLSFFTTILLGLFTFCFVLIPIMLKCAGINPLEYLKAMAPALITAFSTSSSAATLPITIECVEKRVGVSNRVTSFVLPLGLSMNMAGSALYECVAVLFIAQVYGISLSVGYQVLIAFLSLIVSMGVGGIPSGSLVGVMIILNAIGLPAEGIALILPLDRILDMCRTTANVYADATCAALIARSEGEELNSKKIEALS